MRMSLALTALMIFLSACVGAPPASGPTAEPAAQPTAAAAAPAAPTAAPAAPVGAVPAPEETSEEELVIGWVRDFTTLDPHKGSASADALVMHSIFDRLIEINGNTGEVVPGLATEWSVSEDGLVWTLKLREGVTFHDGTPFNAEAVKFNFDRVADPTTKSEYAVFQLGPYQETRVIDDTTVEVVMTEKYGAFPRALATYGMGMMSPAHVAAVGTDNVGVDPVGTGPFKFVEWVQQSHMAIERNPDYKWAPEFQSRQIAYFKTIRVNFIPENATRAVALENSEVQAGALMAATDWTRLKADTAKYETATFTRLGYPPPGLFINVDNAPTDDLRVRQALIHGIDSEAVRQIIYEGTTPPSGGVISSHATGFNAEAGALYPYDPARAGQLLDEAGWVLNSATGIREKDGVELALTYLSLTGVKNVAEVIEPMLRELGFKPTLQIEDNPAQQKSAQSGSHNVVWTQWGGVDPSQLKQVYACNNIGSGWNFAHYCNERFEELMAQGDAELDPAARVAIYNEVQQILMQDATIVPLNNQVLLWVFEKDIGGLTTPEATGHSPYLINVFRYKP